tara:strand:- start:3650 stop:4222 length:573 start_codon:yes stop_codon:yes gene_type:complete
MVDNIDLIISCVAEHLGIENIISANELRQPKKIDFANKQDFAVAKIRKYEHYLNVYVWKSVKTFKQDSRPVCDYCIQVDSFGQLYKKKKAGRRKSVNPKDLVSFSLSSSDIRLMEEVIVQRGRSHFIRCATKRAVYLEHLMWIHKDPFIHTRPIPGGWGLYKEDGSCIATNTDEVLLLRNELPYSLLLTR